MKLVEKGAVGNALSADNWYHFFWKIPAIFRTATWRAPPHLQPSEIAKATSDTAQKNLFNQLGCHAVEHIKDCATPAKREMWDIPFTKAWR